MTAAPDVEALLFDLGGVVYAIDFDRAFASWAHSAGVELDTIRARFSFDAFYDRHERGEILASEYFASLRSSLGIALSDAEFVEGWNAIFLDEIPRTVEILRVLAPRVPIYAFSNSNLTHLDAWETKYAASLTIFREVFVSCHMGKRKPEAEAFRGIAATIGVPLERILFFDDTRGHVDGALAVGMQAVHVRSAQDVEDAVARFLP
jgi:glucose-1-phosphatase